MAGEAGGGEAKGNRAAAGMAIGSNGGAVPVPKRRRRVGAEAAKVDRISALPARARLRIMGFLSLKPAIRMAAASRSWLNLWNGHWPRASSLSLHLGPKDTLKQLLEKLERRGPGRRLIRFSLTIDSALMKPNHFKSFLEYAGDCSAEDIHVDSRVTRVLWFPFQTTSRSLVRLSLRGIRIARFTSWDIGRFSFDMLEVIDLHSVQIGNVYFSNVVMACPRLRVLSLRRCDTITHMDFTGTAGANLESLTVADCALLTHLYASTVSDKLRSFCYSSDVLLTMELPATASFADLYVCFGHKDRMRFDKWFEALPNLANLTVLTMCSFALQAAYFWFVKEIHKLSNLPSLRELQLIMFEMGTYNINHIYALLKNCRCPQLQRLFVQLPIDSIESLDDPLNGVREIPENRLQKLTVVKMTRFKWHRNEVELVHTLLTKASSLQKLILVPLHGGVMHSEAKRLLPPNARTDAHIILCNSDEPMIRPFHTDAPSDFLDFGQQLSQDQEEWTETPEQ